MSSSILAIPAADQGWTLLSGGREIDHQSELRAVAGDRRDVIVALPVSAVSTFATLLPPADPSLQRDMILAQVDKRGLSGRGMPLIDYDQLDHDDSGDLFSVRVAPDLATASILPTAGGYTTTALLHAGQTTGAQKGSQRNLSAVVWKELGRLALAIFLNARPIHTQVLSGSPESAKDLATEINLIFLGLKGESVIGDYAPTELVLLLDDLSEASLSAFREKISIPVRTATPRFPLGAEVRVRLLPPEVTAFRRRRRALFRNLTIATLVLITYTLLGTWVWKKSRMTQHRIEMLERSVALAEPDVERVRQAEQRWQALQPSFDKSLFPVVQLSRLTSALPGSGVVIREYRTSGRDIRVRGQARDVQLANQLVEDLRNMEAFRSYEWSMPNPRMEKNNTATFEIVGKLKHEGTEQ